MAPEGDENEKQLIVPWSPNSAVSSAEIIETFKQIQVHARISVAFKLPNGIADILFRFHKDKLLDRAIRDGYLRGYSLEEVQKSIIGANVHYVSDEDIWQLENRVERICKEFNAAKK